MTPLRSLSVSLLVVLAATVGCRSPERTVAVETHAPPVAPPPADATKPVDLAGLHNVVTYAPGLVCGSVPEGREGLETLAAMGVKTVVSVDGATPDVDAARAFGIRYVHLPISYSGVTPERQKELAQAVANLEQPVYVHCHHGKHRSAAALASAVVLAGKLTPETAAERMKVSGTAADYRGLWQAVAGAKPLDAAELAADPAAFPAVATVSGMVATMAEIDAVFDNLKVARKAQWQAPADHPDLVPAKETRRLVALFSQLESDPESKAHDAAYQAKLAAAIADTRSLDEAMQGNDTAAADARFAKLEKTCKDCHKSYRDN